MVNNAGTGGTEGAGKVHEMKDETWDFVMYVTSCFLHLSGRHSKASNLGQLETLHDAHHQNG